MTTVREDIILLKKTKMIIVNIKYDTTLIDRDYLRRSRRQSVRPFS